MYVTRGKVVSWNRKSPTPLITWYFLPRCPEATIQRTLTPRNAQVPALERTRCTMTSLIAQVLLGAKLLHTCTHVFRTNDLARITTQQRVVRISQCTTIRARPAQPAYPLPPKTVDKEVAGHQRSMAEGDIPSNMWHMLKYFISRADWRLWFLCCKKQDFHCIISCSSSLLWILIELFDHFEIANTHLRDWINNKPSLFH